MEQIRKCNCHIWKWNINKYKREKSLEDLYGKGEWKKVSVTANGKYYSYQIHYYEKNGVQYKLKLKGEPKERK